MISFLSRLLSDYLFVPHELERRAARKALRRMRGRVLDVGCGSRPYAAMLPAGYVAMDANPKCAPDVVGSVESIPFPRASFDGVVCTEVLEHVSAPESALREIRRVLRQDGLLYITTPFMWGLHYAPQDFTRWTPWGLRQMLEGAGFRVVRIRRIGGVFSVVYSRLLDVFMLNLLIGPVHNTLRLRGAWRLAALLCALPSLAAYGLCRILDKFDDADALGWSVLAEVKV